VRVKKKKRTKANRVIDRAGWHIKADFVVAEGFFYINFLKNKIILIYFK
jgi:hypothetical protein